MFINPYMTSALFVGHRQTLHTMIRRRRARRLIRVSIVCLHSILFKGALSWYGKLTWESAHAWNLIILCLLIVWGMTFIFMVHLSFYAIPLLIYDVMYDITSIP